MTKTGKVSIILYHVSGLANQVKIVSSRPDASKVFIGKSPEQLLATVPLLFSVCGNAQAYAALQACRAALGITADPRLNAACDMLLQLENLREHVWRILLDWSGFVGLPADKKSLAALLKFDARFKQLLFRDGKAFCLDSVVEIDVPQLTGLIAEVEALIDLAIFDHGLSDFQRIGCEAQLLDWLRASRSLPAVFLNHIYARNWQAVGQNGISCLPDIDKQTLSTQMQQADLSAYARTPQWQGHCFETTPLNRQIFHPLIADLQNCYQNGLMVRVLARLLEVGGIPAAIRHLLQDINDGCMLAAEGESKEGYGLAQVQAARGLLIHYVVLQHGLVKDYCIVAPTEWNFHPEGVVSQALKTLQAGDAAMLKLQAQCIINAIDPCVQYDLIMTDSDKAP